MPHQPPASADDRGRDHSRLPGVVWATGWVSLLTDMSTELIYPVLSVYYQTVLQLNVFWQGFIEGLAEAIASVTKLISGHWSDRTGGRKWWMVAGYGLSAVAKPLLTLPFIGAGGVTALRAGDRFGKGIRGAPRDALISLAISPRQRGHAFGINRAMDHTGAMLGSLIAGTLLLLGWVELTQLFIWTLVPGLAAVLIIVLFVREPRAKPQADSAGRESKPKAGFTLKSLLGSFTSQSPAMKRFMLVLLVFSLGNSTDALLLLRSRDLLQAGGMGPDRATACVPFLWALLHVFKSISSTWGGKLSDRVGRRAPVCAGWAVYALVYAGFALPLDGSAALVGPWILFAIYGLYFGLTESPQSALVADLTSAESQRGTAYGLYHFVVGVSALPASVLCGGLWWAVDKSAPGWGPAAAFGAGATLAIAAALLLPRALRVERQ